MFHVGTTPESYTINLKVESGPCRGRSAPFLMQGYDSRNVAFSQPEAGSVEEAFQHDLGRIHAFAKARDLAGLEKAADALQSKWSRRDELHYAYLMSELASLLGSIEFNNDRRFLLAAKYAQSGLSKASKIPVETEVALLLWLARDIDYLNGKSRGMAWSKQRSSRVRLWLQAARRLEKEIDRSFDVSDSRNWPLANTYQGQAEAEKNRQKAEKLNRQMTLRQAEEDYWDFAEPYLIEAYMRPPLNTWELRHYLDLYLKNKNRKARILARVSKRLSG